jgi:biotin transport system substrate-specific component
MQNGSSWRRRAAITPADLAQAAVFAALIAALGLPGTITIGASGVPITLQTLGVMLAGSILGARKGALAVALFAALAIAGLPILAGARTGLVSLASPTAGFFVGWLPAVIVIGVLSALMMPRYRVLWGILINIVGGMAVIYAFGTAGLMIRTDMSWWAALSTNGIYLPGDIAKAVVAAVVAAQVHRARPGLITPLRRRRASA